MWSTLSAGLSDFARTVVVSRPRPRSQSACKLPPKSPIYNLPKPFTDTWQDESTTALRQLDETLEANGGDGGYGAPDYAGAGMYEDALTSDTVGSAEETRAFRLHNEGTYTTPFSTDYDATTSEELKGFIEGTTVEGLTDEVAALLASDGVMKGIFEEVRMRQHIKTRAVPRRVPVERRRSRHDDVDCATLRHNDPRTVFMHSPHLAIRTDLAICADTTPNP